MTFRLSLSKTFKWPVEFSYPAETGGELETATFTATFLRVSSTEAFEEIRKSSDEDVKGLASQILLGWEGIQDVDGEDFPYSEENKAALFEQISSLVPALLATWESAMTEAAKKNSKR